MPRLAGPKCSECNKAVDKDALRLGVGWASPSASDAASYKWQHWACVTDRTVGRIGSAAKLQGLAALRAADSARVEQRFASAGKVRRL